MFMHLVVNHAVGHASAPERRTGAFSMLALGISISTVAGPVSAGFLIDLAGHAGTFLALALLPWLALVLLGAFGAPTTAPATVHTTAASTAPPARPRMADLLRHAPLRAVFIVSSLLSMGWDLFTFMAPMHGDRIGLSASTIGLVMGAFGAGTFVVRLLIPSLARRYSGWQVLAAALALTARVYVLFPLSETAPTLLALAFVLGLGLGCAMPMIMSALHDCAPPGRSGEAIGVRSMLINASQAVLPAVFGALGSATGTGVVFWAVGGLLAGGCVYAARHHRHPH
jgi:predicted MFS family arabinose efflux permease